jgi:hypothetical protein
MPYTFIAAIADGRLGGADYRDWTRRQLADHNLHLDGDELKLGGDLVGFYAFLDRDQGAPLMPTEARRALADLGPYSGNVVGYLNWTHTVDERAGHEHVAPAILPISRSIVARTNNGHYRQAVRCVEFSLSTLVGKHGFADGDALISRDDDYLSYVQREAQAAITATGLSGDIVRFESHHNPIRLAGDLRLHGRVVDDPERELAGHRFRIWALDLASLADWEFWSD